MDFAKKTHSYLFNQFESFEKITTGDPSDESFENKRDITSTRVCVNVFFHYHIFLRNFVVKLLKNN
jgi:hypothetical protein